MAEAGAIEALADFGRRLDKLSPFISRGYDEANAKKDGLIRWESHVPAGLDEVILQGPHFGIAAPFNKQPNIPCRSNKDYQSWDLRSMQIDAVPGTNYRRATDRESFLAAQDQWDGKRYTEYFRLAWRDMVPLANERSLFAAILAPGPSHVHAVKSMMVPAGNIHMALVAGFWAALPLDYLLRITGRGHLQHREALSMPMGSPSHPLAMPLLLRTLRLNCLTDAYAPLWAELYSTGWTGESWAVDWPGLAPLGEVGAQWEYATPLRSERERRSALVELDALVAVWLGITAEQLVAVYRSRYPVLADYDAGTWFDATGRKIAATYHAYGHGQTKDHYLQLRRHLESPDAEPAPEGYTAPFHKAHREAEYHRAHAVFTERVERARSAGEWDGIG